MLGCDVPGALCLSSPDRPQGGSDFRSALGMPGPHQVVGLKSGSCPQEQLRPEIEAELR